ncbi:protein kinase [bacterium]|nr:protein kinase [bacterium]
MALILPPGTILNVRYKISRVIHQPGLSSVYHVQDQHMAQKSWAVREIYFHAPNQAAYMRTVSFFQAEILLTKKFEHPNLATVVDYFNRNSAIYIVRNYVDGTDLDTAMHIRQLTEADILYIGMQMCDLLIYLCSFKERNFIPNMYKNLRLSNLVLHSSGLVTMLDLCCSDLRRNSEYCSPEQFTGASNDEQRILVYNMGAMLYHLFTGINPGETRFNLPPPDNYRLDMSRATIQLLTKATQTNAAARTANLSDLLAQLTKAYNAAVKKSGQKPKPLPSKGNKTRSSSFSTVSCLLLVILILGLGVTMLLLFRGALF